MGSDFSNQGSQPFHFWSKVIGIWLFNFFYWYRDAEIRWHWKIDKFYNISIWDSSFEFYYGKSSDFSNQRSNQFHFRLKVKWLLKLFYWYGAAEIRWRWKLDKYYNFYFRWHFWILSWEVKWLSQSKITTIPFPVESHVTLIFPTDILILQIQFSFQYFIY
jgi:hypothetical protein